MKIRKIPCAFCCWLVLFSLTATARAASVTIHNGGELGADNLSSGEYVFDIAESGGNLYFMVTEDKIICSAVNGTGTAHVYTPEMVAAGLHFLNMEPAASGGLWVTLETGPQQDADRRVVLFRDGRVVSVQSCADRANLSAEGAIWKDGAEFVCWDGSLLKRFPIPAAPDTITQFVLWNGLPCFVDYTNKSVLVYQTDGQTKLVYTLPKGNCQALLAACGGDVFLSHRVDDGVSPIATNKSLVRLSDGKQLSNKDYNMQHLRLQSDGMVQMMVTDSSFRMYTYTQVSISQDSLTEREVGVYLTEAIAAMDAIGADGLPIGWRFTDSTGNQWIYSGKIGVEDGRAAVTKVTSDGTTVDYTAEALSGFALYHQGAGVSFDVEPYITDTGFTMVPVRGVAYLLNADITWDGNTQTVTVKQGKHTILLTIGATTALVDGAEVSLGTPAAIVAGRTMLPLRFLTETLGGNIRREDGAVYID